MESKEFETQKFVVDSAHNVDTPLLHDFYKVAYQGRPYNLAPIWSWLYRSHFHDNKIPLVVMEQDKVIAHAGMIPFKTKLNGKKFNASWYIDFVILPEFQRRGIGQILTEKWMAFSEIYVTFCNEKSMGVFKKFGWIQSPDSFLHYYIIKPFHHPGIINRLPYHLEKILNFFSSNLLSFNYKRFAVKTEHLKFEVVTAENLKVFQHDENEKKFNAVRDSDYFSWRILQSPFLDKYTICSINEDLKFLIKFQDHRKNAHHLDVLSVSNSSKEKQVRQLMATLAIWGLHNGKSHIRMLFSNKERSQFLKKSLFPFVRSPIFGYYTKDPSLLDQLKICQWDLELIDSDFEFNT